VILRHWQTHCIDKAYEQYTAGQSHFLCLATPGAGKTLMASRLAKRLLDAGKIDLIICFSPSIIVAGDFQLELEKHINEKFDGLLGSRGCSLTYQSMLCLPDDFWDLFIKYRVFVIFDEIHHCAGNSTNNTNAWGEKVIANIQGKASFTLALTGTPWRSDCIPITLAKYRDDNNQIHCDFKYGLSQAVNDNVCRLPKITIIDNNEVVLHQASGSKHYASFRELLDQSECRYQQIIECDELILYILRQANQKLNALRTHIHDAGGLIVAASVMHAKQIQALLGNELNESATVATYREDQAASIIKDFKYNSSKWIISVGMISEGTNIPRLRVCCHLTRVKTELYFRQVLGRILRTTGEYDEKGFFYMPAEPTLVEYAHRVADDIPIANVITMESMPAHKTMDQTIDIQHPKPLHDTALAMKAFNNANPIASDIRPEKSSVLAQSYESTMDIFGRFHQEVVTL